MISDFGSLADLVRTFPSRMGRQRVEPIHTAVPGRARLLVSPLWRDQSLKHPLEMVLIGLTGIRSVSANPLSGTVLVLFDQQLALTVVIAAIESVLDGHSESIAEPRDSSGQVDASIAAWHTASVSEVADAFATSRDSGLTAAQIAARRALYGANAFPTPVGRPASALIMEQVSSLPVMILLASTAISLAAGGFLDAVLVLTVIAANAAIGYVTTRQAERLIRSLSDTTLPPMPVLREGGPATITAEEIVPGDLLLLSAGIIVPADGRIIEGDELSTDESSLTGESALVEKQTEPVAVSAVLADRASMIYRGTTIVAGTGKAVVTAIGSMTELGRIQALAATARPPPTPLESQIAHLGRRLAIASMVICGGIFTVGLLRGYALLDLFRTSVALAVAAIPEGLPTVVTVTLALGIRRMRTLNVFVRRLHAIETLGAVDVICFDKTGTLTTNHISVRQISAGETVFRFDEGQPDLGTATGVAPLRRLLEVAVLCSDAEMAISGAGTPRGSGTELALLKAAIAAGIDVRTLRDTFPMTECINRTPTRRYMRTTHRGKGESVVAVKGNPSEVLALCGSCLENGRQTRLLPEDRIRIEAENNSLAGEGLRVLGFATGTIHDGIEAPTNLVWLGLAGMADPVRRGMPELMNVLHRAGIQTIMITGDQSATALSIAREVDLSDGNPIEMLDSAVLDSVPEETFKTLAQSAHVFCRVNPAHKLQIVKALQRAGKVVAMTGDGINDSPALRAADIGVAMGGRGTDAAREMADLVLADDDLATMVAAIREGRTIYRNLRKAVRFLISTNLSEIGLMAAAIGLAAGAPLVPAQLLWLNLVTDVAPAVALGVEPAEADVLQEPPRNTQMPIFASGEFTSILAESSLIAGSSLVAHLYGLARLGGAAGGGVGFMALIMSQLLQGWSNRSALRVVGAPLPLNRPLALTLVGLAGLHSLATLLPVTRRILHIGPLDGPALRMAGLAATLPFLVTEGFLKRSVNARRQ